MLRLDHLQLSRRWRNGLVWSKYGLLFATLALSLLAAVPSLAHYRSSLTNPFCQVCLGKFVSPFLSSASICWSNWNNWITGTLTLLGFAALGIFFLGAAVRRLYCRVCPVGGLSAPFNRYGLVSLRKQAHRCTRCGACARVCPVDNLTVYEGNDLAAAGAPVDACECTLCLRCVENCPEGGCLELTMAGRRVVGS
jgi:NAD-dependent dihydropyrimidine dehydrogenase PreA subunit